MLEILKYSFFQNALIGGLLIAIISSFLGIFVVMRKEANISHSISNFLFFGIAISLFLNGNYYFYAFIFSIIASILLFFIEKTNFITSESSKEIISISGLALGIFTIGFIGNLSLDINNFLFGSILFINSVDLIILSMLLIIIILLFILYSKRFQGVIINKEISKSKGIKVDLYNFLFLILLSFFISISIKIFGIMLVGAFLIIPANIGKIFGKSFKNVLIISIISSIFSVIIGLFLSYFLNTNSGASIIIVLLFIFITGLLFKKIR